MFAFWGAEINFRGRVYETKTFFFCILEAWTALMRDYRRRNEEGRPSIYSMLFNLMVKGDYMSKA